VKRPWFEVLNVSPDAYLEDAKTAMRKLIFAYHSDRLRPIEGLHPDFYKFADDRLKEINLAYEEARMVCKPRPNSKSADSYGPETPRGSDVFTDLIVRSQEKYDLEYSLAQARKNGEPLGHVLLIGHSEIPANTIAKTIAFDLGVTYWALQGSGALKVRDIAGFLTDRDDRDILLIADVHRLYTDIEDVLTLAMQEFELDVIIGEGKVARNVTIDLGRFTLIGITPTEDKISPRLLDAFKLRIHVN
jgi:Holliday junction resolvasome RuvABC ATP-dependent DNA helicase subunit